MLAWEGGASGREDLVGKCGGGLRTVVGWLLVDRFHGGGAWRSDCVEAGRDGCCGCR